MTKRITLPSPTITAFEDANPSNSAKAFSTTISESKGFGSAIDALFNSIEIQENELNAAYGNITKTIFTGVVLSAIDIRKKDLEVKISKALLNHVSKTGNPAETFFEVRVHIPEITGILPAFKLKDHIELERLQSEELRDRKPKINEQGINTGGPTEKNKENYLANWARLLRFPIFWISQSGMGMPEVGNYCTVQFIDGNNLSFGVYKESKSISVLSEG